MGSRRARYRSKKERQFLILEAIATDHHIRGTVRKHIQYRCNFNHAYLNTALAELEKLDLIYISEQKNDRNVYFCRYLLTIKGINKRSQLKTELLIEGIKPELLPLY